MGWTDNNGNLWIFGGLLFTNHQSNYFNDLWKFDPVTGQWAWMNGSSTVGSNCLVISSDPNCGRSGVYGTLGTPAAGNTPGGRYGAETWVDLNGNFWLYGGIGFDSVGNWGGLSDLWRFSPSTNQWAWMGGSSTVPVNPGCVSCILGQPRVPGTSGVPAAGNTPGGLWDAASWVDNNGNSWLFGGWGFPGLPNTLWQFNPSSNEWAWMGGSSGANTVHGTYGVLGRPDAGNIPGSRWSGTTWTDANGNLWLFGGQGYDASDPEGILNDLWEFNPSTNQWAWMGGSSTLNCADMPQKYCHQPGVYGTFGIPSAANIPGSRLLAFNWKDVDGNLWLFGGQGFDVDSNWNSLNDLWMFNPSTNQWAWMGGDTTLSTTPTGQGVYGTLGTPALGNQPGRRSGGVSWTDKRGNFWLWGGIGIDANHIAGYLNDLWVYQPSSTLPPPGFIISGTEVNVAAGATVGNRSTITVTPIGGFTGSVVLTAALTTGPSGAVAPPTFNFNSTSPVSITSSTGGAGTLSITTIATVSKPCGASNQIPSGVSWYAESGAALAGLFLFVVPKRGRTWRSILVLVLSFIALVGGVAGCSSGSGSAPCSTVLKSGTSAGTYIITVTGISGSMTKTGTVTVTVQ
jgi:N-acetylneuraminic acid mutarotase